MKAPGPDFHVIGLPDDASLAGPESFEGKNQFLKIHAASFGACISVKTTLLSVRFSFKERQGRLLGMDGRHSVQCLQRL
jgi:hypothetical protein